MKITQFVAAVVLVGAAGCVGAGNSSLSTVVDALEGAAPHASPVVEAYVQYLGPDARWAGPALWSLHVSARDGAIPVIELVPAIPAQPQPAVVPEAMGRAPASALGLTRIPGQAIHAALQRSIKPPSLEQVRDRLAHLSGIIQAGDSSTEACSMAVRVRLTRADGSVIEKQGCRASTNWSQLVSELSAEWIRFAAVN